MKRLGISIYQEKSSKQEILEYIDLAHKYGFNRIFSCLLSVTDSKENIIEKFKDVNLYAKERGFEVIVDVSPRVFDELGISYSDLTFFKEIEADGLRLDLGYTGSEESIMTFNPQGLKIEINMSNDTRYIDTIMDYMPNRNNLIGCHNFYPHNYCGLELSHFKSCTDNFTKYGIQTAAFLSSSVENSFGPWPVTDGLPTLEMHRNLPIEVQAKHFIALGDIDDLIISNCFASEDEFIKLANLRKDLVSFEVELCDNVPEVEQSILFDELHFNRGDVTDYVLRSTASRVKYKGHEFKVFNPVKEIKRGDIIIESSLYGHYAGEVQIATKDIINSGKSNVVGRIREEEIFLLDYIKPWQKFVFTKKQ